MAERDVLLLVHAFATLWMVGLIWFVQVVHYPLMARVPAEAFAAYERAHTARTVWVTAPLMLLELGTAGALAALFWDELNRSLLIAGALLVGVVWVSTFGVQVPLHRRLERGKDDAAIRRLVGSNWVRTVAWSLRGAVALLLLLGAGGA